MVIVDYLMIVAFFLVLAVLLFFVATSSNAAAHEEDLKSRLRSARDNARETVKERSKEVQPERVISYLALCGLFAFFIVTALFSHKDDGRGRTGQDG